MLTRQWGKIMRNFSGPDACVVWTEGLDEEGDIRSQWLVGKVVGEWQREGSFRTDAIPEKGGKVVNVPDCIYQNKNIMATPGMIA